tara:strand:+ start:2459 stop:3145 length:687 start_codon:yes stop_codon:yes gene_type:complete
MSNDVIVSLKNVNLKSLDKTIFSDVSLKIYKGELIYIIGKTGSGKSSLMKILYGDTQSIDGSAKIAGFDLINLKPNQIPFLRREIGIIFQDFKLLPDRNIAKNLEFVLRATEWSDQKKIEERINETLDLIKLKEKKDKYPNELSGGEQQRIAIARAILNKPKVILADEPTGNLDPATSLEVMELLKSINREGTTVLIATHDYDIISNFPSKTIRIDKGKFLELSKKNS